MKDRGGVRNVGGGRNQLESEDWDEWWRAWGR